MRLGPFTGGGAPSVDVSRRSRVAPALEMSVVSRFGNLRPSGEMGAPACSYHCKERRFDSQSHPHHRELRNPTVGAKTSSSELAVQTVCKFVSFHVNSTKSLCGPHSAFFSPIRFQIQRLERPGTGRDSPRTGCDLTGIGKNRQVGRGSSRRHVYILARFTGSVCAPPTFGTVPNDGRGRLGYRARGVGRDVHRGEVRRRGVHLRRGHGDRGASHQGRHHQHARRPRAQHGGVQGGQVLGAKGGARHGQAPRGGRGEE